MKLEALKELAAKVESEEYFPSGLRSNALGHTGNAKLCLDAYNGSLDAAKALHDAVLPNWCVVISGTPGDVLSRVSVGRSSSVYTAEHDCIARAWLLAILRALIAQEESK